MAEPSSIRGKTIREIWNQADRIVERLLPPGTGNLVREYNNGGTTPEYERRLARANRVYDIAERYTENAVNSRAVSRERRRVWQEWMNGNPTPFYNYDSDRVRVPRAEYMRRRNNR